MGKLTDHEQRWAAAMRAANRGCAQSYDRLLHEVAAALRIVAAQGLRRGLSTGDVEDVVQECLIAIHLKRHTWDETGRSSPGCGRSRITRWSTACARACARAR